MSERPTYQVKDIEMADRQVPQEERDLAGLPLNIPFPSPFSAGEIIHINEHNAKVEGEREQG